MKTNGSERYTKVNSTREVGQGMTRRSRYVKVHTLLASSVAPGSKGLALGSVKGQPIDVVGGGPSCHSDNVVILEEYLLPFDFIF